MLYEIHFLFELDLYVVPDKVNSRSLASKFKAFFCDVEWEFFCLNIKIGDCNKYLSISKSYTLKNNRPEYHFQGGHYALSVVLSPRMSH